MDEIALREAMVAGIRRSLFGPDSLESMIWPGSSKPATLIDSNFQPKESRPIGPWVHTDGQEILDQLPHRIYGTGVLYSTKVVSAKDIPDAVMELDDEEDESSQPISVEEAQDEVDDEVNQLEQRNGSIPQSLAFSIRVPENIDFVDISLEFGTYSEFSVDKQKNSWWKREPRKETLRLSTTTERSEKEVQFATYLVKIGTYVRASEAGSRIITVWVQNDTNHEPASNLSATSIFQVRLSATVSSVLPYTDPTESEVSSLDLLYRGQPLRAIGHGCDVRVTDCEGSVLVESDSLPIVKVPSLSPEVGDLNGVSYSVGMNDLADFNSDAKSSIIRIITDYENWISNEEQKIESLDSAFVSIAHKHIEECRVFLSNIKSGWELLEEDLDIRQCLQDASAAMNQQRVAYGVETREVEYDPKTKKYKIQGQNPHVAKIKQARWRPFQIAFILANLVRASARAEIEDSSVDVIWMPTGGGKTEAYLGLSAFIILWERRLQVSGVRKSSASGTTKVFMRYTYRLLTVQQLTRAASLICALEIIREKNPERYGTGEVRIGCWLGGKTTPNTRKQAVSRYRAAKRLPNKKKAEFVLTKCPWCGAKMAEVYDGQPIGYRIVKAAKEDRVMIHCPDQECHFRSRTVVNQNGKTLDRGIPLFDTDEDLYDYPPDFVVGTVDKVAMMAWKPQSGRLFGISEGLRKWSPPAMLIQDELHLISGSLGSIDASFETMIEKLCTYDDGRKPLIIASTATTKNYSDQIANLYARESRIVPPPGLDIKDSFFARQDDSAAGKLYVGIAPTGFVRAVQSQTGVLALVTHFVPVFERAGARIDPYWTNVAFFSSRRALGMVMSSVEESFKRKIRFWRQVSGLSSGVLKDGEPGATRFLRRVKQITATASEDVNVVLDQLALEYPDSNAIDLCYATSMVEVGLDVPRLGLMTVMGQPKGSSQYIQVTGRVGRKKESPALILVAFNTNNVRDRSHFESFRVSHERLYASVESASVTPFTRQALDRSVRSATTALLRILNPGNAKPANCLEKWDEVELAYVQRANFVSPILAGNVRSVFADMKAEISAQSLKGFEWEGANPFLYGYESEIPVERLEPYWRALRSMRSVDADALGAIMSNAGAVGGGQPVVEVPVDDDDENEI
jgi:hypothetical protein